MSKAREMIEQEQVSRGPEPKTFCRCETTQAAERVIERLQQRIEELITHGDDKDRRINSAEKRIEELEREDGTNCASCALRGVDAREAYRARLDAMVGAFNANSEALWQSDVDGKTRSYQEFVVAEAAKYIAAIDAFVAKREK